MSFARSVEPERDGERLASKRDGGTGVKPAFDSPLAPSLAGPAALRPAALLQRQAVLGNAHVGRVFRSPAGPMEGPEQKKDCNCPDEEHCSCPK
jgi:hypothetical protein